MPEVHPLPYFNEKMFEYLMRCDNQSNSVLTLIKNLMNLSKDTIIHILVDDSGFMYHTSDLPIMAAYPSVRDQYKSIWRLPNSKILEKIYTEDIKVPAYNVYRSQGIIKDNYYYENNRLDTENYNGSFWSTRRFIFNRYHQPITRWDAAEHYLHILVDIMRYNSRQELCISFYNRHTVKLLLNNNTHTEITRIFNAGPCFDVQYADLVQRALTEANKLASLGIPTQFISLGLLDNIENLEQEMEIKFQGQYKIEHLSCQYMLDVHSILFKLFKAAPSSNSHKNPKLSEPNNVKFFVDPMQEVDTINTTKEDHIIKNILPSQASVRNDEIDCYSNKLK